MHSNRLPKQRAGVGLIATHSEGVCLFAAALMCKASLTQSIESMSKARLTFAFYWTEYAGSDAVDRTLTPSTEQDRKQEQLKSIHLEIQQQTVGMS